MCCKNPWLTISYEDYENHMAHPGVRQLQVLRDLTRKHLELCKPGAFMMLGCCTGNGFEHIDPAVTRTVYGIDINPAYLNVAKARYASSLKDLRLLALDLNTDALDTEAVDLVFAGLIFEYVDAAMVLPKLMPCMKAGGNLVVVIQQTLKTQFVSETPYHSLKSLSSVSGEVNEKQFLKDLKSNNFHLLSREKIDLNENKRFIALLCEKRN